METFENLEVAQEYKMKTIQRTIVFLVGLVALGIVIMAIYLAKLK